MTDTQREAFEAWLRKCPDARFWNMTDAMLAAWQAALTQPQAQQAIKQDLTTEQQAAAVPAGFKLIKDSTREERSWPEDYELDNGRYFNTCCNCERLFLGHKRRIECKACATAAPPAPVLPLSDERIRDAAKESGLDWQRGFIVDDTSNRYEDFARAIEEAHGITAHGAGGEPT